MATGYKVELNNLPKVLKNIDQVSERGLVAATLEAHNKITKAISRTQPTTRTESGKLIGLNPSKPGEYPKVVSRRLMQSLGWKVKNTGLRLYGRVETDVEYARQLEYGGRSFLRRGIKENLSNIGRAFIKGVN